jgi:endonuclease/exonuclease/phosphatase (EEP) superfamily protein YafD
MGDLNDGADSEAVKALNGALDDVFARRGEGPGGTFPLPAFLPDARIDFVFASREMTPLRSYVLKVIASDHYPLIADLAVPGAKSAAR